ncbi:carbohydrate-binding module family 20 protein [Ramaria rubella]|nr:carbohydrate-binding module family 20 protein [Ramaria rubella]
MILKVLIAVLVVGVLVHGRTIGHHDNLVSRAPNSAKNVIVQMFEWTWDSVASECMDFLGPGGYGFVQVSPPQEHITGTQWWTDYQPVSYTLTSKRGNRTQFSSMVNTCHTAGVKVITDTIFNHMTAQASGTGIAGSSFTQFVYPGIYEAQDFHYCGLEPDNIIVNYDNRLEVQTCELDGLADLGTGTEYVRGRLAEYANDLFSLGVDGLRLDAAKHMAATDVANITSRFTSTPYITQEVIFGAGEPITPNEYIGIGDVQEFRFATAVKNAFSGSAALLSLQNLDNQGWVPGAVANVFVANHDTERNGNSLNSNSPSNTYVLATIFSLAHSYGTPTVLSSYTFATTDDGAPNGGTGTCSTTGGENGWLCQQRWPAFAGMVTFHNIVSGNLTNFVSGTSQQIAFGRGSSGFVAINNEDTSWTATFTTSLSAGTYCDVVAGPAQNGVCAGSSYAVSSTGIFSATISSRNALAIHIGAKSSTATPSSSSSAPTSTGGPGTATVNFAETATTVFGDNIFVVGSVPQLGNWDPDSSIAMSSAFYPVWTVTVSIPESTEFQYKYIRKTAAGDIVWESDPNRNDTVPSSGSQTLNDSWR